MNFKLLKQIFKSKQMDGRDARSFKKNQKAIQKDIKNMRNQINSFCDEILVKKD